LRTLAPEDLPRKRGGGTGRGHIKPEEFEVLDHAILESLGKPLPTDVSVNSRVREIQKSLDEKGMMNLVPSTIKRRVLVLEKMHPRVNTERGNALKNLRKNVKQRRKVGWGGSREVRTPEAREAFWNKIKNDIEDPNNQFKHPRIAKKLGMTDNALRNELTRMRLESPDFSVSIGGAIRKHVFTLVQANPKMTSSEVGKVIGRSQSRASILMREVDAAKGITEEEKSKGVWNPTMDDIFREWHVYGKRARRMLGK